MTVNAKFYDAAADFYDEMVSFDTLLQQRKSVLAEAAQKRSLAADLGCGTGVDSVALSLLGLKVTAFDNSENMLKTAFKNARHYSTEIEFIKSPLDTISDSYHGMFDLAVSLGNTLANLSPEELKAASEKMHRILKDGGRLLLQVLNYDMILKNRERIVNIKEAADHYTVRFYDFAEDSIAFNILRFSKHDTQTRELISTPVYPHTSETLQQVLALAGFNSIEVFGDLRRSAFEKEVSKDVVITAIK